MSKGNPTFQVRLPEPIIQQLDQACGGVQHRQAFVSRMIEAYCTPEAEKARQTARSYEDGLKHGRMQGQTYAEMSWWLSQVPPPTSLPAALATWRAKYPADWRAVERLLLNSPSAAAFSAWYAQQPQPQSGPRATTTSPSHGVADNP